ncbi:MAG: hypothetical protein NTU53_19035 [Planctomycetota bacterium]|nr:hypothetical protein [Planctomycetota bacterium]
MAWALVSQTLAESKVQSGHSGGIKSPHAGQRASIILALRLGRQLLQAADADPNMVAVRNVDLNGKAKMRALIIMEKPLRNILDGKKTCEIRAKSQ